MRCWVLQQILCALTTGMLYASALQAVQLFSVLVSCCSVFLCSCVDVSVAEILILAVEWLKRAVWVATSLRA